MVRFSEIEKGLRLTDKISRLNPFFVLHQLKTQFIRCLNNEKQKLRMDYGIVRMNNGVNPWKHGIVQMDNGVNPRKYDIVQINNGVKRLDDAITPKPVRSNPRDCRKDRQIRQLVPKFPAPVAGRW